MMICKVTLFTVALALLVSARPIRDTGVRVTLPKRTSLTRPDGVFDHDKAILQTVMTKNKHRQNMINLERNVGRSAFKPGADILPLATLPSTTVANLQKRQKESLTDQDDQEWTGSVSIGTPAQTFVVDVDNLWVPSSSCSSSTCSSKSKYAASSSSTSSEKSGTFEIQYGDGSTVSGPIYTDTVVMAGIKATNQYFSPVTNLSSEFADDPADGLIGFAFPAISNLNESPFFNTAYSEGTVSSDVFGLKLASSGSELFLGGTDSALYTGAIEYHAIDTSTGFWQATGARALVGSTTAISGFETVIDSGTTIMYGPPSAVQTFYSHVPGATLYDSSNGYYSFSCASIPSVAFSWGGKSWSISAANFNLGETESGSGQCVGALAGQDIGLGTNTWLLGDSFLKNVYSAFNFGTNEVGFASL